MAERITHKLTSEQRNEIIRRALAGETSAVLGPEFGVTRAYVSMLKAQALDPERFERMAEEKLARKLTRAQQEEFIRIVSTSTPEELDLIPHREHWTPDHGHQLVWRLFKKKASVRAVKEMLAPYMPKREDYQFPKPKPPKPHHINQLDPELAKDPEFVAYYLSPICEKIAKREYELALADWEARFAADAQRVEPVEQSPPPPPVPTGRRVGKHAKSKGSPFTPAKRRKKRR